MKSRFLATVVAACLVSGPGVSAQTRVVRYGDDRLAGITEVDVVVRVSGSGCDVRRAALQQAAIAWLRESGLRATLSEQASSWHHTVFVTVETASAATGCASVVLTELIAHVEGFPEADKYAPPDAWGSILIGPMSLVREMTLATTAARDHDRTVQATAQRHLAALAERVKQANGRRR